MLDKIVDKIQLLPKEPKENEILCDTCGGIGWLQDTKRGYIEKCPVCYDGVLTLCPICHQPKRGMCQNPQCRKFDSIKSERNRFDKAIKANYEEVPDDHKEMLFSESYSYNEGYFSDIEELIDDCNDNNVGIPEYVWSTTKDIISIDAGNVIEQACEELHEDAYSNIVDEQELQDFLDKWCDKQSGTDTFTVNYKYTILLNK